MSEPSGNDCDFFLSLRSPVMEIHLPLYHVHGLIARVDVKLAAVFPAPGDERRGVGFLPKNAHFLSAFGEPAASSKQTDAWHLEHG